MSSVTRYNHTQETLIVVSCRTYNTGFSKT